LQVVKAKATESPLIMETGNGQGERPTRQRIEIKVSEEQKETIVRAAALANQGVSSFVRDAAERAARELISKRR
jgi:uncharacterized protein (DUF1778 family)